MQMVKRIFLFVLTNFLIIATISIVLNVLGVQPYMTAYGIDYPSLMIFCLVWGFGGAFISLALSRQMAKWMMGVKVIDPQTRESNERWLVDTVHRLARQAKLTTMPQVGMYDSPEMNAFATGPTRSRSLVAVSTGLLQQMNPDEVEGVLGHEIAHVANGDMVTMTLVQGVVNAFVMFIARVVAHVAASFVDENKRHIVQMLLVFVLDILLSFLALFVVAYYSRIREFRADQGGARLTSKEKMIGALQALQRRFEPLEQGHESMNAFKISTGRKGGLMALISTHPSLETRIARLQRA